MNAALSAEQLELRKSGIGASEIGAVVGLDPFKRPIDVFAEKTGDAPPVDENRFMRWGKLLEDPIAEEYASRFDVKLERSGTIRHPKHRFLIATPDRVVLRDGKRERNLQIKTSNAYAKDAWGEEGTDEVPDQYIAQVTWEMLALDLELSDLAVLIGGNDFRIYTIGLDKELAAYLVDAAGKFWRDHVEKREPPPAEGTEAYTEYLKRRFPKDQGEVVPASEMAVKALHRAHEAVEERKRAEAEELAAKNELRAICGSATEIEGVCTWKNNKSGGTDWKALALSLQPTPAQVAKFLKPGPRVLRLKGE